MENFKENLEFAVGFLLTVVASAFLIGLLWPFITSMFRKKFQAVRRIVNGVVYNTQEATLLAIISTEKGINPSFPYNDYLFKSNLGNFFIVYVPTHQEKEDWGDAFIEALTPDQAFTWLNKHQEVGCLMTHFKDRLQLG